MRRCVALWAERCRFYLTPPQSGFLPRIEVHDERADRAFSRADDVWHAPPRVCTCSSAAVCRPSDPMGAFAARRTRTEASRSGATAPSHNRPRRGGMSLIDDRRGTGCRRRSRPIRMGV